MNIADCSEMFATANLNKLQFGRTMNRFEPKRQRNLGINDGIKGVYFIFKHGDKTSPYYIGETGRCIKQRISNHKKSLNNPDWKVEITGSKFINAGIDIDQEFDIWYIDAKDIECKTKKELIATETLFMTYFQPKIWN